MTTASTIFAAALAVATSTAGAGDDDDVIIVIDDDDSFVASASTADDVLIIEDDDPGGGFEVSGGEDFGVRARAGVRFDLRFATDTSFDRPNEQVGELIVDGRLVLEVDLSEHLRVYAAPQLAWIGGIDREGDDREVFLTRAPEAFVGYAEGPLSVRAGYLVFDWGQSEIVGPNDVLNPPDLRRTPSDFADDNKIPVPGVEVVGALGPLTVRGVVLPVFVPARFFVTGWDVSALQGGLLPIGPELSDADVLEPAFIDQTGDLLLQTDRPRDRPDNATLGLRLQLALDDVDIAASIVHGFNPFPSLTVDPSLVTLGTAWAEAQARGETLGFDDPAVAGALVDLQDRLESGAPVFKGKFERRTVVGLDMAWALDPFVLKLDAAYNTRQVSYTRSGQARTSPTFSGVVGAEYYWGEQLQVWVELFVQHILEVAGTEPLAYVEANLPMVEPRRGVTWYGGGAFVRYQALDGDLVVELGAIVTSRLDFTLLPRITYALDDHHRVYLGGLLVEGRDDGLGGAYTHLDQLYLGYRFSY